MSDYIKSLTPSLFWDIDRETIDDEKHRRFVIGRVLERGRLQDWRNTKARYGLDLVVREAQQLRSLEPRALAFIACMGQVAKETFRCFALQPSHQKHWIY